MKSKLHLIPQILGYRLSRTFSHPKMMPINLTVSVTNMCNSHCKTCFIWKLYHDKPELKNEELKIWEFERTFESIGKSLFWVSISGGEPFLRPDLPQICEALCEYCEPSIINIPTNSLLPETIEDTTKRILEKCNIPSLIINLSLDELKEEHDKIRGVLGNFDKFLDTFHRLQQLKLEFPNLHIGIHSVVSKHNINKLLEVYEYAKNLQCDSYITEIAEHRTELFNKEEDITPSAEEYTIFIEELMQRIKHDYFVGNSVSKTTQAFRLTYYQIATKMLQKQQQIIPCYACYASGQISAYGDVWACCILGYDYSMGNLRENNYDFHKIWFSQKANEIRQFIKDKKCACPLANAHYTSILCNLQILKVLVNLARFGETGNGLRFI